MNKKKKKSTAVSSGHLGSEAYRSSSVHRACALDQKNKQKNTHTKQKIQCFLSSLRTEEESSHIHASVGIHWWKPFVLKPVRVLHENKKGLGQKIQGVCAVLLKQTCCPFVFFSLSEASFLCKLTFTDRFTFA